MEFVQNDEMREGAQNHWLFFDAKATVVRGSWDWGNLDWIRGLLGLRNGKWRRNGAFGRFGTVESGSLWEEEEDWAWRAGRVANSGLGLYADAVGGQ